MNIYALKNAAEAWEMGLSRWEKARTLTATFYANLPSLEAERDNEYKHKAVQNIISSVSEASYCTYWQRFLNILPPTKKVVIDASLRSRLMVNMSGSVLENAGIALEFASGVPIIPGSAVKGAARRHALTLLKNTPVPEQPDLLNLFLQVFGCVEEDFKNGDLKAWDDLAPESRKFIGRVSFLQAVPQKDPKLCCEVLTPHHMEYMSGKRVRPYDDEAPVPNFFPAVEAGENVIYSFALSVNRDEDIGLLNTAAAWLRAALVSVGIGAKGSAGYGLFDLSATDKALAEKEPKHDFHPIIKKSHLQFITPCFSYGGNQDQPEIRAASVRGELRWWFRCLGGSRKQEETVFGGAAKDKTCSSAVQISVTDVQLAPKFKMIAEKPDRKAVNSLYFTFFLMKNNKAGIVKPCIPPGTRFVLEMRQLRDIPAPEMKLLCLAWDCMCNLGSLGARKSRAFGALAPCAAKDSISETLMEKPQFAQFFSVRIEEDDDGDVCYPRDNHPGTLRNMLTYCADILKRLYRMEYGWHPTLQKGQRRSKKNKYAKYGPSVLGDAGEGGSRQSSAIRFRPYLRTDGQLGICILKAPIHIVVGDRARGRDIEEL